MQRRIATLVLALGLASCAAPGQILVTGFGTFKQEGMDGLSNAATGLASVPGNALKVTENWDDALLPISCKDLTFDKPYWRIKGRVVAYGVLYADGPLTDPAAAAAVGRKLANHIGPGC